MKLKAAQVQEMIDAEDGEVVAHGYTLDRDTLDIYFEDGRLVRSAYRRDETPHRTTSEEFESEFFFKDVKRWYAGDVERWRAGEPGAGLNQALADLFETFGRSLSVTSGGRYP